MSDILDDADASTELHNRVRMRQIEFEARQPIPESKICLECAGDTLNGARWCSVTCRNMWELRQR